MKCKHNYTVLKKGEHSEISLNNKREVSFGQTYAEFLGCTKCGDIKTYEDRKKN